MIKALIISEFSKSFDKQLACELLDDYQQLKEAELQNKYDYAGQAAGKYFETVMKILLNVKKGLPPDPKGINFETAFNLITSEPKLTIEDEILCMIIPYALRSGYTLRNKKRISHARGINPSFMDSRYLSLSADWIMAELLRLYHSKDDKEIEQLISRLVARRIPLMQEIKGEKILLHKDMPASVSLLLSLYSNNGSISSEETKSILSKYYKLPNVHMAIKNCITERKIHKDKENVLHLTELGYQHLEQKLVQYL